MNTSIHAYPSKIHTGNFIIWTSNDFAVETINFFSEELLSLSLKDDFDLVLSFPKIIYPKYPDDFLSLNFHTHHQWNCEVTSFSVAVAV